MRWVLLLVMLASCKVTECGIIKEKFTTVDQHGYRHTFLTFQMRDSVILVRQVGATTYHVKKVGDRICLTGIR